MINFIIPPIIFVVLLTILILFLTKKSSVLSDEAMLLQKEGADRNKLKTILSSVNQFGLRFLERVMQWAKLLSLKLHNTSNDWFHSIRKKREEKKKALEMNNQTPEEVANIEKKEKEVLVKTLKEEVVVLDESAGRRMERPMLQKRVVLPDIKRFKKDNRLEEALIKRIAMNPRDIEAYERLGDYYVEGEVFPDALECYRQVLKLSPGHHKAKLRIRKLEKLMER